MPRRRKDSDSLPFDTLRLEGSLFVPELLERASRGVATSQTETDYAVPKGLKLYDEYGRAFRIATALWQDFATQIPRTDLDPAKATRAFTLDLLRQCLGYIDLAVLTEPVTCGDRGFPVTAMASGGRIPVIIAPHSLGLDYPDPHFAVIGSGSRKKSPHQLAQEFLNASPECLWAIITNGRTIRLLRDAETLTRPNFLEFDLESILRESEDRYADFSALWRILHSSRGGGLQPPGRSSQPSSPPADSIWEKWKSEGHAQGLRVRDGLRDGVTQALLILGTGFLRHPDNDALRQRLHDGTLTKEACFQQLLRLIYRCLFLFCAEERDLLHAPDSSPAARQAYATGYSLRRFRSRSLRQSAHDPHGDLWISLKIVFRALATGQEKLALPALGGLFAETQCPDLDSASLANRDLLAAMRELRWFFDPKTRKRSAIDYRNMGPEELGSVYESLLELVPTVDLPARTFGFVGITDAGSTAGNTRKTTGSYYTPDSLVQELIKSALVPVLEQKIADRPESPIEALLSLKVCDPACGSGHFLLAAARRLAEKLAELRAPDGAVRPDDYRHALREVVNHCVYGVDLNPMAVELCKVALWLESVELGKPLGFLDPHIQCGNSLLGATPRVLADGLPDDAFKPLTGDDKAFCANAKKQNKLERKIEGHGELFDREDRPSPWHALPAAMLEVETMDDDTADALHRKEQRYADLVHSESYQNARFHADAWCAAFVWKKCPPADGGFEYAITNEVLRKIERNPHDCAPWMRDEIERLRDRYQFFHWHLAFPEVFPVPANGQHPANKHTGWNGGFDVMLGNPPWERVKLQEKEWFAERRPNIAKAPNAASRKRLIEKLAEENPSLYAAFGEALRQAEGESHLLRDSGLLPLCGRGDVNLFAVFAERFSQVTSANGRAGCIVPGGIATDDTTKDFFSGLVEAKRLVSLHHFENEEFVFQSVHHAFRFCLLTFGFAESAEFVFYARQVEHLNDESRKFSLTADDFDLLNPNSRTCPTFRSRRDAELNKSIYRRGGVLNREVAPLSDPWGVRFLAMVHMANDSGLFRERATVESEELTFRGNVFVKGKPKYLPLYEAKMVHHFDHRFGTYDGQTAAQANQGKLPELDDAMHADPALCAQPYYWVPTSHVADRLRDKWSKHWLLGWRDITGSEKQRTVIATILPIVAAGHTLPLFIAENLTPELACCLSANLSSFSFDYTARVKVGGTHLTYFYLKQLPVLPPATYAEPCAWAGGVGGALREWLLPRVLELTYTAWDLESFARDCGWFGPPFVWDEARRFQLRCELDAAFFHLYGLSRDDTAYILDTFPIVRRNDEAAHGTYRTKDTILQIYDALAKSMASGISYQDRLPISPAEIRAAHDPRWPEGVRPALDPLLYFQFVLPLMMRLQWKGIERSRLLHAIEILTDSTIRSSSAAGNDFSERWATGYSNKSGFSDGAGVLIALLQDGNLSGVHQIRMATDAKIPIEDPWLALDAFMALRLAMQAPSEVVEITESKRKDIVATITRIAV